MNRWELYKTLEVPYGASKKQLKEAYRRLAKKYHPDLTKNSQSGAKLSQVIEAYSILSDTPEPVIGKSDNPDRQQESCRKQGGYDRKSSFGKSGYDISAMGKMVESAKTEGMRAFAARTLGLSGRKTAYAYLRRAFSDPSPIVVKTAVEAVGNLKIQQCAGELAAVFSRGNTEIREAVLRSIKKIGLSDGFKGIITAALNDRKEMIRAYARELFSRKVK